MRVNQRFRAISAAALGFLGLAGCDQLLSPVDNNNASRNVNITSSAVFIAQRDGDKPWYLVKEGNTEYVPNFSSLLVNNSAKRYEVIMVCPATADDVPHRVYYYLATVPELSNINHQCRKSQKDIVRHRIYGAVKGVDVNNGAKGKLALGQNTGDWVYEAYAFEDVDGVYDLLGMVGTQAQNGSFTPTRFFKRANVGLGDPPTVVNIDFDAISSGATITSDIPNDSRATATVSGVPQAGSWQSSVTFRSEHHTAMTLAEGPNVSLDYYGLPIYVSGSGVPMKFQSDDEGHEFSSKIFDSQNRVTALISHFFKNPHDMTISMPNATLSVPSGGVSGSDNALGRGVKANWSITQDTLYGSPNLFHWIIKGDSAAAQPCSACGGVLSEKLEWHILVTAGWLGGAGANMQMQLNAFDEKISTGQKWSPGWNFRSDSAFDWDLVAYYTAIDQVVVANDNQIAGISTNQQLTGVEALLNHLFDREYVDGLTYAQLASFSQ